jgi:hydroxyacylglutathione hydrolase
MPELPEVVVVPCRSDNYAYLVRDPAGGAVVLVDAPEAAPIIAALDARGWTLGTILLTHHHDDHVAGVEALRERYGAAVVGAAADRGRLPALDVEVAEGDEVLGGALAARVYDAPGHTRGHVAYHMPAARALFPADSLMVMGCGRLFEGTADEMWATLSKLAALPPDTLVYSGHDYAEANMRFALSLTPDDAGLLDRAAEIEAAGADGAPTVPAPLSLELRTNPFLRAADPAYRARLGLGDDAAAAFAEIRRRKDAF